MALLPDGLVLFAKNECPTCKLIEPLLPEIAKANPLAVHVQDDMAYASGLAGVVHDSTLEVSFKAGVEFVPTLIRVEGGKEVGRCHGWHKDDWQRISGIAALGAGLPGMRAGCGSKSVEPGIAEELRIRFGAVKFDARQLPLGGEEDAIEACFDRGWSDGLPLVPPTRVRVLKMLDGADRRGDEVIGLMPPSLVPCTVEKVAINAVMAGCKPEYFRLVLAVVEAALIDKLALHGILCTAHAATPLIVVNGPIARQVGLNSGINALGQGNRANSTIGRALQLVVRNVGGGRPGEIDRATFGWPGKYSFCFAEAEVEGWEPLSVSMGARAGKSAVTMFAAAGFCGVFDDKSRSPESLTRSLAATLRTLNHMKAAQGGDVMLVVSPEHSSVYLDAGWSKARLIEELESLLVMQPEDIVEGAHGIAEGFPASVCSAPVPKFAPGGILVARAGGKAGRQTALIPGWVASGPTGTRPVTFEIA